MRVKQALGAFGVMVLMCSVAATGMDDGGGAIPTIIHGREDADKGMSLEFAHHPAPPALLTTHAFPAASIYGVGTEPMGLDAGRRAQAEALLERQDSCDCPKPTQCCYVNGQALCLDLGGDVECPHPPKSASAKSRHTTQRSTTSSRKPKSSTTRSETSVEIVTVVVPPSTSEDPASGVDITTYVKYGSSDSSTSTSSLEEQSQTTVNTTSAPASPAPAAPSCDENASCTFPPGCSVQFPGFINCNGGDASTTSLTSSSANVLSASMSSTLSTISASLPGKQHSGVALTETSAFTSTKRTHTTSSTSGSATFLAWPAPISSVLSTSSGSTTQKQGSGVALTETSAFTSTKKTATKLSDSKSARPSSTTSSSSSVSGAGSPSDIVYITTFVTETVVNRDADKHVVGTGAANLNAALPTPGSTAAISQDGKCGPSADQTCTGSSFGNCCSIHGDCGSTPEYCDANKCMLGGKYGACFRTDQGPINRDETNIKREAEQIESRQDVEGSSCGYPDNTCWGDAYGNCCSIYGYCGSGPAYCSNTTCDGNWGYCWGDNHTMDGSDVNANPAPEATGLDKRDVTTVAKTTVKSTVTAWTSVVYFNEATVSSTRDSHGPETTAQDEAISMTTAVVVVNQTVTAGLTMSSTTTTMTKDFTLTDPLNTHVTAVVPLNTTMTHVNNTSIDTNSYINISTFKASGLTLALSSDTTSGSSSHDTVTSTKVIRPSATETRSGTSDNGMLGFSAAATSNVAKNTSSAAPKMVEVEGSYLPMLAGFGFAGVFGLFLML